MYNLDVGGEENEQMDVGQDWVCFDVEKEYGRGGR